MYYYVHDLERQRIRFPSDEKHCIISTERFDYHWNESCAAKVMSQYYLL